MTDTTKSPSVTEMILQLQGINKWIASAQLEVLEQAKNMLVAKIQPENIDGDPAGVNLGELQALAKALHGAALRAMYVRAQHDGDSANKMFAIAEFVFEFNTGLSTLKNGVSAAQMIIEQAKKAG